MRKVSGNVVSEIKFGKLGDTLRVLQECGMVTEDLRWLRKDYWLALEVFRVIRDQTIFKNKCVREHWRTGQIEKFAEWNKELCLGISEEEFRKIPEKFPNPPACSVDGLYCTCLVYEWGDPLQTLLNGFRVLDYELRKLNGKLRLNHSVGGIWEEPEMFLPEAILPDKVRIRPGTNTKPWGFRFIVAELGRATRLCQNNISTKKRGEYFKDLFVWSKNSEIQMVGQELPYIAAMYPSWITSVCGDSRLHPRPLALDVQISQYSRGGFAGADKYVDYFEELRGLCLREDMSSDYPAYAKGKRFKIEADGFMYRNYDGGNGISDREYGICTIVK